jgi:group II intron reverse transcriptase/maturase
VKRVHIPKDGNKTRPIGIPATEDKIVQRAYTTVLEAIYEQDFYDCSYGFRRKRSAHQALGAIWKSCMDNQIGWILDADISAFFDTLDHQHLRSLIERRVIDGRVRRMLDRWLKAGVMEGTQVSHPDEGTPQGGNISPLLANIYLHYVLDEWFHQDILPRLRGRAFLIRYADDFIIGFEHQDDALRVLDVLPKRLGRFGLTLHPEKTGLVPFRSPGRSPTGDDDVEPPAGTFNFLGFTHFWAKSRKGHWIIRRKTMQKRLARFSARMQQWCRKARHLPVKEQRATIARKLNGHYNYYGITGNYACLHAAHEIVCRVWHSWLNRRSQRKSMTWDTYRAMLTAVPLPRPQVKHSLHRLSTGPANR